MRTLPKNMLIALVTTLLAGATQAQAALRYLPLADSRMITTAAARSTLKYLASCALDAQTVITARHDGVDYQFAGSIGLAPQWHARAMTEEEQHWVSACMLARTNYFGAPVEISLRTNFPSPVEALSTWRETDRRFTQEEATFFGNLFADKPVAYVCSPAHDEATRARIAAQKRICALPKTTQNGQTFTACGMVYLGDCSPDAYTQAGVTYRQALNIFLLPQAPDAQ